MKTDRVLSDMMTDADCRLMVNEALMTKLLDLSKALQALPDELHHMGSLLAEYSAHCRQSA